MAKILTQTRNTTSLNLAIGELSTTSTYPTLTIKLNGVTSENLGYGYPSEGRSYSKTFTGLSAGTSYTATWRIVSGGGTEKTDIQTVFTKSSLSSQSFTSVGNNGFTVNWSGKAVRGFKVLVKRGSSSGSDVYSYDLTTTGNSYQISTSIQSGTTYWVQVQAIDGDGNVDASVSNTVTTTSPVSLPSAPSFSTVTPYSNSVSVSWYSVTGATSYGLEIYSGNSTASYNLLESKSFTTTSGSFNGLTVGRQYTLKLYTRNSAGNSTAVTQTFYTTVSVSGISTSSVTKDSFTVNWTGGNASYFYINVRKSSSSGTLVHSQLYAGSSTSYYGISTLLESGTTYWVQVQAMNDGGIVGGSVSTTVATTQSIASPSFSSTLANTTGVAVSWSSVTGAVSYGLEIYSGNSTSATNFITSVSPTGLSHTFSNILSAGKQYTVRLYARGSSSVGNSTAVTRSFYTTVSVSGLSVTNLEKSSFTVNWSGDAPYFYINVRKGSSSGTLVHSKIKTTSKSYAISTLLAENTTYWVQVQAMNEADIAVDTVSTTAITKSVTVPSKPTISTLTPSLNSAYVSWGTTTGATSYGVEIYNGNSTASSDLIESKTITTLSHTFSGLTVGKQYTVKLYAKNSAGNSTAVTNAFYTTVSVSGLSTTNVKATSFTVDWTGSASYFYINVRKTSSTGTVVHSQLYAGSSTKSYAISTLLAGNTTYWVQVQAMNDGGNVGASASVTVKTLALPSAPTISTLTPSSNSVYVSWGAVTGATSYGIEIYNGDSTASVNLISSVSPTTTSHTFSNLTVGKQYTVKLYTRNSAGNSVATTRAFYTTVSVSGLSISNLAKTSFTVNWTGSASYFYVNVRRTSSTGTVVHSQLYAGSSTKSYAISTSLEENTTYWVQVQAMNDGGVVGDSASTTTKTLTAPPTPTISNFTPSSNSSYVSWGAVTGATSYGVEIYNGDSTASSDLVNSYTTTYLYHTFRNLTVGKQYTVKLYTKSSAGNSTAITRTFYTTVIVSGLSFTNVKSKSFTANWSGDASYFYIDVRKTNSSGALTHSQIKTTSNSYEISTLLEENTTYWVQVQAMNDGGIVGGSVSNAIATLKPVSAPAISVITPSLNSAYVSWGAVTDATSYGAEIYNGDSTASANLVDVASVTTTSHTFTGLAIGKQYTVRLYSRRDDGNSTAVTQTFYTTVSVSGLTISNKKSTSFTVNWSGSASYFYINVRKGSSSGTLVHSKIKTTSKSYAISTSLEENTTYWVQVQAINTVGSEGDSSSVTTTTLALPSAPTFNTVAEKSTSVTFSWNEVVGALSYGVEIYEKSKGVSAENILELASKGSNERSHTFTGLLPEVEYTLRVYARGEGGNGTATVYNFKTLKPLSTPVVNEVTSTTSSITISWKSVTGATSYGVEIYNGNSTASANLVENKTANSTTTTITFSGLSLGKKYTLRLYARGEDSNSTAVTTEKYTDVNLSSISITKVTKDGFTVNWVGDAKGYYINVRKASSTGVLVHSQIYTPSTVSSYGISTLLEENTTYWVQVQALDEDNNHVRSSSTLQKTLVAVQTPVINTLTFTNDSISVSWNAVSDAISYGVEASVKSGSLKESITVTDTKHTFKGLLAGTFYSIKLYSRRDDGNSVATIRTLYTKPNNMGDITLTSKSENGVSAKWNAVTGATSYKVVLREGSNSSGKVVDTRVVTSLTYDFASSLELGKAYYIGIVPLNVEGSEGISNNATFTLPPPPPLYFRVTARYKDGFSVAYTGSAYATKYKMEVYHYATGERKSVVETTSSTAMKVNDATNISEYVTYQLKMWAVNSGGNSEPVYLVGNTFDATPPTITKTSETGDKSVSIYWKAEDKMSGLRDDTAFAVAITGKGGSTYVTKTYLDKNKKGYTFETDGDGKAFVFGGVYGMRVIAFDHDGNESSIYGSVSYKGSRPQNFAWTTVKTKGVNINLTASEWNGFCTRINDFRKYRDFVARSFVQVKKGDVITASVYNDAFYAIREVVGVNSMTSKEAFALVTTLTADSFNSIVKDLNSIT